MLVNPYKAKIAKNNFQLNFPYDKQLIEKIKLLDNRRWNPGGQFWSVKISLQSIKLVIDHSFDLSKEDKSYLKNELSRLFQKEQDKKYRIQLATATNAPAIPHIEREMKLTARSYQWVPTYYALLTNAKFIIADDMAAGKSIESLMITRHKNWKHKPVMILTKSPSTFKKEIFKFFGEQSLILDSPLYQLYPHIRYYLVSYERLKYLLSDEEALIPRAFTKDMFWIIDEAHLLKNRSTKRFKYTKSLVEGADHIVALTGTPVENRAEESYSLISLLDKDFMSHTAFMKRFLGQQWTGWGMRQTHDPNLQALRQYLFENLLVRREKAQVLTQLPEKHRMSVDMSPSPIEIKADSMFEMFNLSAQYKANSPQFLEWLENAIEQVPKVGIFAHHKVMMDAIEKLCKDKGYDYVKIDSSSKMEDRQGLASEFAKNPSKRVAILSMNVAGTGINELQAASLCIFTELPWTPGLLLQCEDRFHRPGLQNGLVVVYALLSKFDYVISDLLLKKVGILKRVIGQEEIPNTFDDDSLMREAAKEFGLPLGGRKR